MGEIIQIYRDRKKQEGIPMKLGFVTAILDSWTYEEMMILRPSRDLNVWKWHAGHRKKQKEDMPV